MNNNEYDTQNEIWLKAYSDGNLEAKNKLVFGNSKLVIRIARKYSFNGKFEFEDLSQEGFIGLMRAVDTFKLDSGVPFAKYASILISQSIISYINNKGYIIKIPGDLKKRLKKFNKVVNHLHLILERIPTAYEIAIFLNAKIKDIEQIMMLKKDVLSLNHEVDGTKDVTLEEAIEDIKESPEEIVEKKDTIQRIRQAINKLPEVQAELIRRKYGIERKKEYLTQAAKRLNIKHSKAVEEAKKAINSLCKMPEIKSLRIERNIDRITNFYKKTSSVVLWRERRREEMIDTYYTKKNRLLLNKSK